MRHLIQRLENGERSNELDVLIEVAIFRPDRTATAIRANNAGTKVIYTGPNGREETCLAREWTKAPLIHRAVGMLRSLGAEG